METEYISEWNGITLELGAASLSCAFLLVLFLAPLFFFLILVCRSCFASVLLFDSSLEHRQAYMTGIDKYQSLGIVIDLKVMSDVGGASPNQAKICFVSSSQRFWQPTVNHCLRHECELNWIVVSPLHLIGGHRFLSPLLKTLERERERERERMKWLAIWVPITIDCNWLKLIAIETNKT